MTIKNSKPLDPRPGILEIKPYVGGESELEGMAKVMKLSSNEGALGPSPRAVEAYKHHAAEMHRYPDGGATKLCAAIAARYGLDAERIVCGAGSDELITLLCRAYVAPGEEVLYPRHGFLMYAINAKGVGGSAVTAAEVDLTANVDTLLAAVTPRTRAVFLANPNNPTGSYMPASEVQRLRDGLPEDVLLVIDAAYAEYVGRNDYTPGVELVDATANTVMTRTFSKIHGMGGLRLGWAYCPPAVADVLNRLRNPFNAPSAAQAAGIAAIEDVAFTDLVRAHNDHWLPWTADKIRALGFEVAPSVANFVLVHFPDQPGRDVASADDFLRARGIIVRRVSAYGLPKSLRITIGTGDEMQAVVAALTEFVGS
jgi:histidinol-phosphate aminotransferase